MREIKFRAWDDKNKKWMYPYPEAFWIIGETTVFDCLKQSALSLEDYNSIKIMQYTGLEDKNGVEICEDDILHLKGHMIDVTEPVIYSDCEFTCDTLNPSDFDDIEVVGNIHENPELLHEHVYQNDGA